MIRTVCDLIIELLKCSNAQVYIMYGHTTHNMSSGLIASSLFQRCDLVATTDGEAHSLMSEIMIEGPQPRPLLPAEPQ